MKNEASNELPERMIVGQKMNRIIAWYKQNIDKETDAKLKALLLGQELAPADQQTLDQKIAQFVMPQGRELSRQSQ